MRKILLIWILAPLMAIAATLGDDGLYDDPMFEETFLDLAEDNAQAQSDGKLLMVIVEQNGCPYCREMHEVNFAKEDIRQVISENFFVIQLDLWGSRDVTGFDGGAFAEKDWAAEHMVHFTPTTLFFNSDGQEVFRMPGYFKPFHHISALEYVSSGAYQGQPFQRYLQDKFKTLEAQGIDPKVWE